MYKTLTALAAALLATAANADTLIHHVNGIQVDIHGKLQQFSGVLVGDDGKVARLIRADEPLPAAAQKVDGGGRTMLPGLIDAHGHVMELGQRLLSLDLKDVGSIGELQRRLVEYAAANPGDHWILGGGWNQELWPDSRFPTAADLDQVVRDRPVWLQRVDGHAALANSAAMRAAGITTETSAPSGGRIDHGLFVDNAMDLVERRVPPPSATERDRQLAVAQQALLASGLTTVADMWTTGDGWAAFKRAAAARRLDLRILGYAGGAEGWRAIGSKPIDWQYSDHLRLLGMKIVLDGALGSRGAWLKTPYSDQSGAIGLRLVSDSALEQDAKAVAAAGGQLAIHAIGDQANTRVIELYEELSKSFGTGRRWRIEHFQIVDPKDIQRLKPAGIVASMQPTHQTSDWRMAEKRLGSARLGGAYAWRSVLASGAALAFGSDFPIESPNPFPGIAAAISRKDMDGQPPGGWRPEEKVTLAEALDAFTRGGAYAGFAEGKIGTLAPGKWADFILIDRDPTSVGEQSLARTKVLETWVAGRRVFVASAARGERGK